MNVKEIGDNKSVPLNLDNNSSDTRYSILGNDGIFVFDMVEFFNENSVIGYPQEGMKDGETPTIDDFVQVFYEEAKRIRVEVAWVQTMLEQNGLSLVDKLKLNNTILQDLEQLMAEFKKHTFLSTEVRLQE